MKKLLGFLFVMVLMAATVPWGLYSVGLWNALGRPSPPVQLHFDAREAAEVWHERSESAPPALRSITPWHFYHLVWCSRDDSTLEDFLTCGDLYPGLRAAAYVAKHFLVGHVRRNGILWRYLSRTALTIWISNTWSANDLVAELVRLRRSGAAHQ